MAPPAFLPSGDSPLWKWFWDVHDCHNVAFFKRFVNWLRANYRLQEPPPADASRPNVVFVSRKDVGTRQVGPEDEVVEWLKANGVAATAAKMGHMPFREQVETSSKATVLVAVNGAGMVHQLWQPEEAVVIEARQPRPPPLLAAAIITPRGVAILSAWRPALSVTASAASLISGPR